MLEFSDEDDEIASIQRNKRNKERNRISLKSKFRMPISSQLSKNADKGAKNKAEKRR